VEKNKITPPARSLALARNLGLITGSLLMSALFSSVVGDTATVAADMVTDVTLRLPRRSRHGRGFPDFSHASSASASRLTPRNKDHAQCNRTTCHGIVNLTTKRRDHEAGLFCVSCPGDFCLQVHRRCGRTSSSTNMPSFN